MRRRLFVLVLIAAAIGFGLWQNARAPEPTLLSFGLGQTLDQVMKNSTYPVMDKPGVSKKTLRESGGIWVTEPAVIIRFNDPRHGFTLPPTKFASLFFLDDRVATLATTPMLDKLPFDQAVAVLEKLQNQFKAGAWEPWRANGHAWFDFSPAGHKQLYEEMFTPGWSRTEILRVPNKYSMTFRLKCAAGCNTREPPYLFLIDIALAHDFYADGPGSKHKEHDGP